MGTTSRWRTLLILVVGCIVLAEVTSALALMMVGRPVYWSSEHLTPPPSKTPSRTENEPWGAWGKPNTTSRLVGQCFDVAYTFNDMGARDRTREKQASQRWVVLGDSFIEGYGLEEPDRFTSILEKKLGWQFANFGAAGDHGPLQYLMVYKNLAQQLEHQGVIVGLLPFNDFTDNDAQWWRANRSPADQARYRPYAIPAPDGQSYRIIYGANGDAAPRDDLSSIPETSKSSEPDDLDEESPLSVRGMARGLSKVSATLSLLRQVSSQLTLSRNPYSGGYFTTDPSEVTAAKLALRDLSKEIGDRPKILLVFPAVADLDERARRGAAYSDEVGGLLGQLKSDGWLVIDLADAVTDIYHSRDITLGCDGHWNADTNRIVADYLVQKYADILTGHTRQSAKSPVAARPE